MTSRKTQTSLLKLPSIIRSIERNNSTAHALFRKRAFELLVYVESAGPGGGAPTDSPEEQAAQDAIDRGIDFFQSVLDDQQQKLAAAGGDSSGGEGGESEQPCHADLELYQAAIKANDPQAAKRYLEAYSNCVRIHAGGGPQPKPVHKATG